MNKQDNPSKEIKVVAAISALSREGRLGEIKQEEIERNMADNSHVFGRMILAHAHSVFIESDVKTPV